MKKTPEQVDFENRAEKHSREVVKYMKELISRSNSIIGSIALGSPLDEHTSELRRFYKLMLYDKSISESEEE